MTVKKVAIIAAAGAVLLAGALTLSMTLITRNKIEVTATFPEKLAAFFMMQN